jgi:hypothetical protein
MAQGGPAKENHEGLTTKHQHPVIRVAYLYNPTNQLYAGLHLGLATYRHPLLCGGTLLHKRGCIVNKKHLAQVLEQARLWTNAEYEEKTTPETDSYHIRQQLARLTLLQHIADTYLEPDTYPKEQRENAQL